MVRDPDRFRGEDVVVGHRLKDAHLALIHDGLTLC